MQRSIILLFVCMACSSPKKDKIVVPQLHAGFYSEALERIDEQLDSWPNNSKLIDQKLFYCEQLEWPTTCISALDTYKEVHGMTNQLVRQYIAYYSRHERYRLLVLLFDRWDEEYKLKNEFAQLYIRSLVVSGQKRRASGELRSFLIRNQTEEVIEFAARQYLQLGDSVLAAYYLGKLYKADPKNDLMWKYGQILNAFGHYDLSFTVIGDFAAKNREELSIQLAYARMLENANRNNEARNVIKPFAELDTISYLLTDWYIKDYLWDSASYVLAEVIAKDSSQYKPVWKMGRLYEDRGWFASSLNYFEYLKEKYPEDTLAANRIDLIQRKIAYLQRLKFEEEKLPTLELEPIKIKD